MGGLSQEAGSRPGEEAEGHGGAEGVGHCHRGGQADSKGGGAVWQEVDDMRNGRRRSRRRIRRGGRQSH